MFGWFKKKPVEVDNEENLYMNERMLYGHNMKFWHYLGRSRITIDYKDGPYIGYVFFFVDKEDETIRSYAISDEMMFRNHPWIYGEAKVWKAAEFSLWHPINDNPSDYLREYMKKNHNVIWNHDKKWWADTVKETVNPQTYWGA